MLSTLEIFGLPENYMEGNGHFPNWGKEKKDDKMALAKKRAMAQKQKKQKKSAAIEALRKKQGLGTTKDDNQKPTHFDL
jgi:hypothetical protein